MTPIEIHNKQVTHRYKEGLHPTFEHFYKYKSVEIAPTDRGEKTGSLGWQLFVMCSQKVWWTCFTVDVGPLYGTVAFVLVHLCIKQVYFTCSDGFYPYYQPLNPPCYLVCQVSAIPLCAFFIGMLDRSA